ncbi:hypothetical protein K2173_006730 [Erythroxylum novogranatense]|uniref:Protein kinase domain-containing protein n=1 Tax=Erythroxylum novogranatense TaxID=1862640 RepID=A0AAV8TEJ2_9ROSI|nr:hypothetical protein K2173_006730 [Erythroxylum novogranatense]
MDWIRGQTIGHGSTAAVSLATSIHSGQVFAVKSTELFQSEFLQREQKILSSISSPHIVSYKGCDVTRENDKVLFNLFLEFEEPIIRCYSSQILQGLHYLHSNGLVHYDIKGSNILMGKSGAKIADFGCARRVNPVESDAAERITGTPMFMAPEVARGEEQGFPSDIWALGCTIIEMATGGPPWPDAGDPVSVIYRVGYSDQLPEFPCCLSEQARDFLDKCLKRDPKERWTASQLLKHPFLGELNSQIINQIQESKSPSNSPTSILDQGFWDESESLENLVHSCDESSAGDKIRRLSALSEGPSWVCDGNWITVRENSGEAGDKRELFNDLDKEMSGRFSREFWGDCRYWDP